MVIILQQTTDNGKRFVSTVVEDSSSSSFNSNFSLTSSSHNSISERSVIYKQRIDSLFGRHTRLNTFKPTLEPFTIRIEGGSHGNFRGDSSPPSFTPHHQQQQHQNHPQHYQQQLSPSPHSNCVPTIGGGTTATTSTCAVAPASRTRKSNLLCTTKLEKTKRSRNRIIFSHSDEEEEEEEVEADEEDDDYEEEEDDYERIEEKVSSIITDSLNNNILLHHSNNGNLKKCSSSASHHVSSILLNCEDDDVLLNPIAVMAGDHNSSNGNNNGVGVHSGNNMGNKTVGESHMWQNGTYGESSPCAGSTDDRQYGIVRSTGGTLKYNVDYLGSIPVDGTTTTLQDLQNPLKELYIHFLTRKNIMSGQLSITSEGLRFEAPKIRLVNPFTTIAVWAAIKFVAQGESNSVINCAFMPLISDPEGQDKTRLFGRMSSELVRAYRGAVTSVSSNRAFRNPPIFACVMRESFSLDCHAFVCKCAEDAIVVAANLYQSLVDKMRAGNGTNNKEGESGYGSMSCSPRENRSSSSASSTHGRSSPPPPSHPHPHPPHHESGSGGCCGGNSSSGRDCLDDRSPPLTVHIDRVMTKRSEQRVVFSDSESVVPVRPPRRKKKSTSSSSEGHLSSSGNLKRYNSDDSILLKMPHRRKSMKSGGQYYQQQQQQYSKPKKRVQISTPEETTSSDSINESIDQVLDRIINPGGMSFNDLKPSYQELILKIALTLTQDQLYQKSKQAMKKHQQFNFRKKGNGKNQSQSQTEGSDENSQFLNLLLKSFSKITSPNKLNSSNHNKRGKNGSSPSKLKSSVKGPPKVILKKSSKDSEEPFMSYCSGCMCDQCSEKCYCSLPSKHNVKIIGLPPPQTNSSTSGGGGQSGIQNESSGSPKSGSDKKCGETNGEPVPLCGIRKIDPDNNNKPRKKTCGYDTDSCEAIEKCYCSLQRVKSNGLKIYNINLDTETSDTDTNSYDFENGDDNFQGNTVSTRSVEILSYNPAGRLSYNLAPPPPPSQLLQTTSAMVHFEDKSSHSTHCNNGNSNSSSNNNHNGHGKGSFGSRNHSGGSSSSSYLHSSPDDLSPNSMHQRSKVLLITGSSNPSTRVVYKDNYHGGRMGDFNDGKKSRADQHRNLGDIEEDHDETRHQEPSCHSSNEKKVSGLPPEKILSMKKAAELAAMFSDLKFGSDMNQTTDVVSFESDNFIDSTPTTEESNASLDFEASLGYLP